MTDWDFCKASLVAVSRTFSKPIEMLPGDLEVAVTCGYLLCRLVDTIEDHPTLALEGRDRLYAAFLAVVEDGGDPERFVEAFRVVEGEDDELTLARNLPRVMRVFRGLPRAMQQATTPWVAEMARGMAIYSHRAAGDDGIVALTTLPDLERYCYFVAGTVGHLLTELFLAALPDLDPARRASLLHHAEAFGQGLQLTNILKDITDDRERGVSFIPRSVCAAEGLRVADLLDPAHRLAAHAALVPVFESAARSLDAAFEYCLALPVSAREIRLFCLLPLWMAVRTLAVARGNDAQLTPGAPVKISREEVASLIQDCGTRAGDDAALRSGFAALKG